jgi:hypothetical protein
MQIIPSKKDGTLGLGKQLIDLFNIVIPPFEPDHGLDRGKM